MFDRGWHAGNKSVIFCLNGAHIPNNNHPDHKKYLQQYPKHVDIPPKWIGESKYMARRPAILLKKNGCRADRPMDPGPPRVLGAPRRAQERPDSRSRISGRLPGAPANYSTSPQGAPGATRRTQERTNSRSRISGRLSGAPATYSESPQGSPGSPRRAQDIPDGRSRISGRLPVAPATYSGSSQRPPGASRRAQERADTGWLAGWLAPGADRMQRGSLASPAAETQVFSVQPQPQPRSQPQSQPRPIPQLQPQPRSQPQPRPDPRH